MLYRRLFPQLVLRLSHDVAGLRLGLLRHVLRPVRRGLGHLTGGLLADLSRVGRLVLHRRRLRLLDTRTRRGRGALVWVGVTTGSRYGVDSTYALAVPGCDTDVSSNGSASGSRYSDINSST